jgi:hypothetical protein
MVSDTVSKIIVPLIQAVVAAAIVVWGWSAVHKRSVERDLANKRRDLRVQHLIDAFRCLAAVSERKDIPPEYLRDLEPAIADIQLFGSADQVKAAQDFARQLAEHKVARVAELLSNLRDDLRDELKLERVGGEIAVLRMVFDAKHEK